MHFNFKKEKKKLKLRRSNGKYVNKKIGGIQMNLELEILNLDLF